MTSAKTATVLGATGLVGSELLEQLSSDPSYSQVDALTRRSLGRSLPKVRSRMFDFTRPESYPDAITTDVLFSALGTTLKKAGSKDAQWKVDYDYQFWAARAAAQAGVTTLVLVSSMGADPGAPVFYSRMKGELEAAVSELSFDKIRILRPGILDGDRSENRPGERAALFVLRRLPSRLLPAAARPVPAAQVARACRMAAADPTPGVVVWEAREILSAIST